MSVQLSIVGGDATKPHCGKGRKVICHICNDMGGWGKGFVMALKETFPKDSLDKHYRRWHKARSCGRQQQPEERSAAAAAVASGPPQEAPAAAQRGSAAAAAAVEETGSEEAPTARGAPEAVAEGASSRREAADAPPAAEEASAEEALPWQEPFRLGAVQFLPTSSGLVEVANMIAQHGIKSSRRRGETWDKVDYAALEEALDKVGRFAAMRGASVHMPRIGSGLAGGDWERIEQTIQATLLEKHGVSVWVYTQ